ncbi:MAG: hypothetical protein EA361_18830 [Bacteroidetes bacterium]|nr:MAG: hypothetical protein EA361_18830 [Bacteroidota bacterium]
MRLFSKVWLTCIIFCISFPGYSSEPTIREIEQDLKVFSTPIASSLKDGIKKRDINRLKNAEIKALAKSMHDQSYSFDFRLATYNAYLHPATLGELLKIGRGYSNYENMTGIYLPLGRHIVLVDNIAAGSKVSLVIPNWNRRAPEGVEPSRDPNGWGIAKSTFSLQNGVNIIDVTDWDGLAYIYYYSDDPEKETEIEVHFVNARVNGYFDIEKHTSEEWKKFLDNAVYTVFDARGRHIQVAYPVEAFKKYAYDRGIELISNYDSLVHRQHRFLGLIKYDRVPQNRILARVNYNYYMFRDGDGVAYMGDNPGYAMNLVVDPERVIKGDPCWGFSHEVGHVHQLNPFFHWGGLGEVSNNVYTMYVTTSFGNQSRISAQENYKKARTSIIEGGISYLQDEDVFNRLVPFWQLQLYFSGMGKYPDFYPDLHEAFRNQELLPGESGGRRGNNLVAEYQLNFVKEACRISSTDLTDFFEKWGFFWVGEFEVNDYGRFNYNMTQKMVDEAKKEIKAMNLPKPKTDITTLED